jgi:hypothetical protein
MPKTRIHIAVGLATLLVGMTAATAFLSHKKTQSEQFSATAVAQDLENAQRETPEAEWEPSFFKALEERTKKVNLTDLRTVGHLENDLEMRFWYYSTDVISGFVIKRSGGQWSATGIRQINDRQPFQVKQESLGTSKSGWDAAWRRLETAGVLTLPDGSGSKCSAQVLDGGAYVVETYVNRIYKTYKYDNPQLAKCEEVKQIILIEKIIGDEFNLNQVPAE